MNSITTPPSSPNSSNENRDEDFVPTTELDIRISEEFKKQLFANFVQPGPPQKSGPYYGQSSSNISSLPTQD